MKRVREAWRYDQAIFRWRSRLAGIYTGVIVVLLLLFTNALVQSSNATLTWWWQRVTVGNALTALLAVGTLGLATAALIQAISAENGQRDRERVKLGLGLSLGSSDVTGPDFRCQVPHQRSLTLRVRNMGPGSAVGIAVVTYTSWEVGPRQGSPDPPPTRGDNSPDTAHLLISSMPLGPGGELNAEISIADAIPNPGVSEPSFTFARRVRIVADCRDVKGRRMDASVLGFELGASYLKGDGGSFPDYGSGFYPQYRKMSESAIEEGMDLVDSDDLVTDIEQGGPA